MSRTFCRLAILCASLAAVAPSVAQDVIFRSGNIEIKRQREVDPEGTPLFNHVILRDQINFGFCFEDAKYRRLPVTYYHPQGPLGMVFQRFNWFPGPANTYASDARLPAALVAMGCTVSPLVQIATLWSEPPVAVIGMNVGTPSAYARPMQHFDFYEPTKEVIDLNERDEKERYFHYIPDARQRGAVLRIKHGAPRQKLKDEGPRGYYHLIVLEACSGENGEKIFLEFFTKEGIAQCMESLADDGVLLVHTSHRFVNLPPILASIGKDLKLHVRRGHDQASSSLGARAEIADIGHFTSEWVALARQKHVLDAVCKAPANYEERIKKLGFRGLSDKYWSEPELSESVWTDKGPNLLHGVLRGHPFTMRYSAVMVPATDLVNSGLERIGLGISPHRLYSLSSLPRAVEDWLVQQQLKNNPQVENLWK
jgi:hypothetical protein